MIQEQIIEKVQVIPRELFPEHLNERDTGCGVALTRRCPLGLSNRVCVFLIFRCPCSTYQHPRHYGAVHEHVRTIEKRTEEIAMLAKRCAEGPPPPSLTSPTDYEQVPPKRRRRTRHTPLTGSWRMLFT